MTARSQPETATVSSFDIFGTLLNRREIEPEIRYQTACRLLGFSRAKIGEFARLRIDAERKASRRRGPDLYSLEDIYREIEVGFSAYPDWKKSAMAAELQMERDECFANHYGKKIWEEARKTSDIIYVTDMYLPADFIRQLLERNGLWAEGARVFVSHAEGRAKHSGLFGKILQELKVSPGSILHVGDGWQADVLAPRKLGIRTRPFQVASSSRYEGRLSLGGFRCMANSMRFSRLGALKERRGTCDVAWETACDVIAPLFLPYVQWVASQAVQRRLERLYFVSRDGLIFKRIYDILKEGHPTWPESRYLFGSRQAWSCVRAAEFQEKDLDFLLYEKINVTPNQVLRRIGFSSEESSRLEVPEWFANRRHQLAGPEDLKKLKQLLMEPAWTQLIRTHGTERVKAVQGYLRQEGLYDETAYGLVDLGWGGNLQSYLDRILQPAVVPAGFYFHLTQKSELTESGRATAWLAKLPFLGWDASAARAALEIFCSAEHGMTTGYRRSSTAWEPILAPPDSGGPEQQLAASHHAAIQISARNWIKESGSLTQKENEDVPPLAALENFKAFMLSPSLAEAEVYGNTRLSSRQEGGDSDSFGPAFTLGMACGSFRRKFAQRETHWPGAIIRRSRGLAQILVLFRFGLARAKSAFRRLLGLE